MESTSPTTSSISNYINLKVENIQHDIKCYTQLKQTIFETLYTKQVTEKQYLDKLQNLENTLKNFKKERSFLDKQRRLLEEDLAEQMPLCPDIDEAYKNIIRSKIIVTPYKQPRRFNNSTFFGAVTRFYDSRRRIRHGNSVKEEYFCALFGWLHQRAMPTPYLVPKSLNSEELLYLFGVGDDSMFSDPRIGKSRVLFFYLTKTNIYV